VKETKAKAFKKPAEREIRTSKTSNAREAIGIIEPNSDTYILTFGQFSVIDALVCILDQTGLADVTISTWTAADAHLERAAELVESASIRNFRMIVDRSFETRQPGYCHHMRKLFGPDCLRAFRTHAKFLLIRSDTHNIVVRTSMNLNENPRLENLEISESLEFAEYFQLLTDEIFGEVEAGVNQSKKLVLDALPEYFQFREIEAKQIERNSTNEPTATHTIKKH